jgi:flagellar protein FliS
MYPSQARAQDEYLLQRINSASPEQLVALLLEGAQRFLSQAVQAIGRRDVATRAKSVNRASAIVEELMVRLNHEDGGEAVQNLVRLYEWWSHEMFEASTRSDANRLEKISQQMGELKATWEQLHLQRTSGRPNPSTSLSAEGMVG